MLGPNVEAQLVYDGEHDNFVPSHEPYFPMDHMHPSIYRRRGPKTLLMGCNPIDTAKFFHVCGLFEIAAINFVTAACELC